MLIAAAVCPQPPLLVPELGRVAFDDVRERCREAVTAVVALRPDVLYVVGGDEGPHAMSFEPWGASVRVDVPEPLPLSLLVGAWLTAGNVRSFVAVAPDLTGSEARELGVELAASADRVALLVMADGSARHSIAAPGYLDERAAAFDAQIAAAFAQGAFDISIDADLADELLVAGRVPWQVLAGAANGARPPRTLSSWFDAPYGVGYHVGAWTWE